MTTQNDPRQPWMHDMKVLVCAPAQLWCNPDGTVEGTGLHAGAASIAGFYMADTRILSNLGITVNGERPVPLRCHALHHDESMTSLIARNVEGTTVDPQLRLDERRTVTPDTLMERIDVRSCLDHGVEIELAVSFTGDIATMQEVKGGAPSGAAAAGAVSMTVCDGCAVIESGDLHVTIAPDVSDDIIPPSVEVDGLTCTMTWRMTIPPQGVSCIGIKVTVSAPGMVVQAALTACPWEDVTVHAADSRVEHWLCTSLSDLSGLRMAIPDLPDDEFLAAGAPWFFTLFGRDSLWAARFLLPLTTRTAMGTLRTLAHVQATASDPETNADPGKIMHELRGERLVSAGAFAAAGMSLPPLYYGTIDATPLWIITLGEALRWGAPEDEVRALLPNLEAALAWMRDWGDCDGDGFLEYIDRTGHGLSNQGWKDSGDSVRWRDGHIADGPIALCEVQGYAYQAAMTGAELLDRFGRPGGEVWREWAAALKTRFNDQFWVNDGHGRYPAIALDRDKKAVDALTSNIGHLLGTGILDECGARDVAARLTGPDMLSGYGVRTMSSECAGYWPQSYHCGSVWAHDSAIAMLGLAAEGYTDEAMRIAEGLIRAAETFGYRIPELYAGDDAEGGPAPYPAACHPQAWSAASSVAVATVLLGMEPGGKSHPVASPLAQQLVFSHR